MKMSRKVRIAIVEDENLVRQSLAGLVQSHVEFELTASGNSVENFLAEIHFPTPDIVLLDINLGRGMSGLEGIRPIKQL